jgi:tetratricopeptide (TPR) repeat protein
MACRVANLLVIENQVQHTFLISASNPSTLKKNYTDIFHLMFVRKNQIDFDEVFRTVRGWLNEPKNGSWLMIMDEFTEPVEQDGSTGLEASAHYLASTRSHGHLVITTSNQATALKLMGGTDALCFEVPPLLKEDACDLLRRKTPDAAWCRTEECIQHSSSLVEKLDNNPSAIVIAAAYITLRRNIGETISTYLTSLKKDCGLDMFSPISSGSHGLGRSPILAWENTFLRICATSPETTDLLAVMSCLDRIIPLSLLKLYITSESKLRSHLGTLVDWKLITPLDQGNVYTMPSLVKIAAHKWLCKEKLRLHWQCRALSLLFLAYEKAATESNDSPVRAYLSQIQLLPHLDTLLRYCKHINKMSAPCPELVSPELVPALVCFSSLYIGEGRSKAARILLYRVFTGYQKNDSWKILALTSMAETMRAQPSSPNPANRPAELKKARDILKQARNIAQALHSRDADIDVLSSLALNYVEDSRFKLAEKHQLTVVGFRELQYPPGKEGIKGEVVEARLRLSKIYYLRGNDMRSKEVSDLERARVLQEKLLAEMERRGRMDVDWIAKLCEVQAATARTYYAQGSLDRALQLARKAHEGRLTVFGKYDLATLGVKQDLAFCLAETGNTGEAESLFGEVKKALEEKFGNGHYEVRKCEERRRRMMQKLGKG